MFPRRVKQLALRLLPDRLLQPLKKRHYANALRSTTEANEPDLGVVRALVEPGSVVIDVGANFGVYTKLLSELVGEMGHVFSIEPVPLTYEILASNIERLGLRNVESLNLAVSSEAGVVQMEVPRYLSGGENFYEARIVAQPRTDTLRSVQTRAMSLDALFGHQRSIDFIKCDVEGHELPCLLGAIEILRKVKPAWLIEISGNPDVPGSAAEEVFQRMADSGYEPFWYADGRLHPRRPGDRSVNYFFLTHRHLRRLPESMLR